MEREEPAGSDVLPLRAPRTLIALAIVLMGLGVLMSPAAFIALGPLRGSLTSDNDLTRHTAELTTVGFRVVSIAASLLLSLILLRWQRFTGSRAVQALASHQVPQAEEDLLGVVNNRSLHVGIGLVLIALAYVVVSPRLVSAGLRDWIAGETGIIERGTAVLFLASSGVIFAVVYRLRSAIRDGSDKRRIVWLSLLGLFFFVCFGEEISWGQRILGLETLDAMKGINVQDENNLHNLMGYLADHLFILGVLVYGALLPLLAGRFTFWRRALRWFGLPIASVGLAICFALASGIHDWTIYRFAPRLELRAAELRELLTGACFFLLALESYRVGSLAPPEPESTPESTPTS